MQKFGQFTYIVFLGCLTIVLTTGKSEVVAIELLFLLGVTTGLLSKAVFMGV